MAGFRLLQATCTIALLAATPALAGRPEAGMTNASGQANPEDTQARQPATGSQAPANSGANTTGMVKPDSRATEPQPAHRPAMNQSASVTHERTDSSQDAAVNKLNDESYQASQNGETFRVSRNDSGAAPVHGASDASGSTNGTSGGPMPSNVSGGSGAKP